MNHLLENGEFLSLRLRFGGSPGEKQEFLDAPRQASQVVTVVGQRDRREPAVSPPRPTLMDGMCSGVGSPCGGDLEASGMTWWVTNILRSPGPGGRGGVGQAVRQALVEVLILEVSGVCGLGVTSS